MGTIGPPRHVEQAKVAARMNPVSALFAAPAQAVQHKQQKNRDANMKKGGITKKSSNKDKDRKFVILNTQEEIDKINKDAEGFLPGKTNLPNFDKYDARTHKNKKQYKYGGNVNEGEISKKKKRKYIKEANKNYPKSLEYDILNNSGVLYSREGTRKMKRVLKAKEENIYRKTGKKPPKRNMF